MRQDIQRPKDTGETFEDIEKRVGKLPTGEALAAGATGPTVNLARNSIRVATQVFQWRIPKRNMLPSDDHIFSMAHGVGAATDTTHADHSVSGWGRVLRNGRSSPACSLRHRAMD